MTGIALAIAVVVVVAGIGAGLAGDPTVHGSDVDYWVVPEDAGGSALVATDGPSLGEVHAASAAVQAHDDVAYATPVLAEPLRLEGPTGAEARVLVVGVIGADDAPAIAGLSPGELTPGDPHYGDGEYDGPWTGDLVATRGAANQLEVQSGDSLEPAEGGTIELEGDDTAGSFTVTSVESGAANPFDEVPVALVQLSEFQALTGAAEGDRADQLLVSATDEGVRSALEELYPGVTVETRSSLLATASTEEELPLAMTVSSLLVVLVVGPLFVGSTLGMAVLADRRELRTLGAIGFGARSRAAVVGTEALVLIGLGGAIGTGLGVALLLSGNQLSTLLGPGPVGALIVQVPLTGVAVTVVIAGLVVPVAALLAVRVSRSGVSP